MEVRLLRPRLPEPFHTIAAINPVFYLIDGIRCGFTGHADGSLAVGVAMVVRGSGGRCIASSHEAIGSRPERA
jgi:hypothetical protein